MRFIALWVESEHKYLRYKDTLLFFNNQASPHIFLRTRGHRQGFQPTQNRLSYQSPSPRNATRMSRRETTARECRCAPFSATTRNAVRHCALHPRAISRTGKSHASSALVVQRVRADRHHALPRQMTRRGQTRATRRANAAFSTPQRQKSPADLHFLPSVYKSIRLRTLPTFRPQLP